MTTIEFPAGDVTCPACRGLKKIRVEIPPDMLQVQRCQACGGTGHVPREEIERARKLIVLGIRYGRGAR